MAPHASLAKSAFLLKESLHRSHALPLRLRALSMFTFSLDILFMQEAAPWVREAGQSPTATARLRTLAGTAMQMLDEAAEAVRCDILPALEARGLRMGTVEECTPAQRAWLADNFVQRVRPLLTPLAVDAGHPFPQISTHSINLLAVLQEPARFDVATPRFARLKVPRWVPRLTEVHGADAAAGNALEATVPGARTYVLSEDMVRAWVDTLFPGMTVEGIYQFRIVRGAEPGNEWPAGRHAVLARQKAWPVVRLDIERAAPEWVVQWLAGNLEVQDAVILRRPAPLGLGTLAGEWADRAAVLPDAPAKMTVRAVTDRAGTL